MMLTSPHREGNVKKKSHPRDESSQGMYRHRTGAFRVPILRHCGYYIIELMICQSEQNHE
jgi:hypothetical protein